MGIILWILKIIGILLAVILGLLLFIVLVVLLVPLRYRVNGFRRQDSGEMSVQGRVGWLASLISVSFGYEKEAWFKIRLLGIPLKPKKQEAAEGEEAEAEEVVEEETETADKPPAAGPAAGSLQEVRVSEQAGEDTAGTSGQVTVKAMSVGEDTSDTADRFSEAEKSESPVSFLDKIRNVLHLLGEKLKGIPEKGKALKRKWVDLKENLRRWKETAGIWIAFLRTDEVKRAWKRVWKQTRGMFRHILPRKVRIRGRFGFADPALTGQITGVMSMIPAFYKKDISVIPDFTESCLEGEFFIKGRVRAGSLLLLGGRILLDSDVRKVYKKFRTIQAGMDQKQQL